MAKQPKNLIEFYYNPRRSDPDWRKIIKMTETDTHISGLDTRYLNEEERKEALELLGEREVILNELPGPIDGYNPEWKKAWRTFLKSSITEGKKREL